MYNNVGTSKHKSEIQDVFSFLICRLSGCGQKLAVAKCMQ